MTAWDKLTLVAEALDNATQGTLLGAVALALILAVAGGLTSVCIRLARNRRERTILAPLDADMCATWASRPSTGESSTVAPAGSWTT